MIFLSAWTEGGGGDDKNLKDSFDWGHESNAKIQFLTRKCIF